MRTQSTITPTQYQQTHLHELPSLKREALAAHDLGTLKDIQAYEKFRSEGKYLYVRMSENVLRTAQGEEFPYSKLPFPHDEISLHFLQVRDAMALTHMPDYPGDLMREVSFASRSKNSREFSVTILEVPDETEFPLPADFNWMQVSIDWIKANPRPASFYSERRRRLANDRP